MSDIIRQEARLIVLKELAKQSNYSLNDAILQDVLQTFGIAKPREWVREELRWLEEIGAVTIAHFGSAVIATMTDKGADHVARRTVIQDIKRPSPASS